MKNLNEKILITGCGGMLGKAIHQKFSEEYEQVLYTDIDVNESWLSYLDVRDMESCQKIFNEFNPSIVIHLAALTDLEFCEKNPNEAWKTNALGTENIALLSKINKALMIYISTAGIFDGKLERYTDFDDPNPLNYYGKSKYYGECFVKNNLEKYFVFRAGWMMGGGPEKDKKFINKIFKQIKDGKKQLFVVDDKLGTPTYTQDFANSIFNVIQTNFFGLYNQVCKGDCSRYDVAKEFVKLLELENEIEIKVVNSDYFKDEYFAQRPRSECLVNLKLDSRNINFMRDWKECLKEYVEEYKKEFVLNKNL